jgi:hypothetical protein
MSNGEDGQPHITKFEFRSKFFAYCTRAGHLLSFIHQSANRVFHFPIHVAISDFHASVYPPFLHSLIVWKQFFPQRKRCQHFPIRNLPATSLGRKLQIKSTLVRLLAKHEQKEQEPQELSSSLTNHLISQSNSDENDALMESILTYSPLPYDVEHEEDERDLPFSSDDCDSSLDSYDSYQLTQSYH